MPVIFEVIQLNKMIASVRTRLFRGQYKEDNKDKREISEDPSAEISIKA